MQHSKGFFIKTIVFSLALFVETLILGNFFFQFALAKNYFVLDWNFLGMVVGLLLVIAYTYALTVGAWDTWLQFVVVPMPISLANALLVARVDYKYAVLTFFVSYLLLSYDVFFASRIKEQLIKFNPKIMLRFSTKGVLFSFALVAGLFVFLIPVTPEELNIVEALSQTADQQVKLLLNSSFGTTAEYKLLQQFGLADASYADVIAVQLQQFIEPYREYLVPIVALLVVGTIHFLNSFVFILFALTIDFVFYFAKKTGVLHTDYQEVTQETLTF